MTKKKNALYSLLTIALMSFAMTLLSSCGGTYYDKTQSDFSRNRPFNCSGLHVKQAEWHYTDSFGQIVDTRGRCYKGLKHGTFDFYVNGFKVATTKYERDAEVYTSCYVKGKQTLNLETCMRASASNMYNNNANAGNAVYPAPIMRTEPVKKSVWD